MNNKWSITILIFALAVALAGCGGGGSGSSSSPTGVNPGVPSSVRLLPIQIIGQTGSDIFLKARVFDGNGLALRDIPVTFTNFSIMGMLSSNVAVTDVHGIATVSLRSNTPGFITVQSEVDAGAAQIRDRKTVFFSELDLTFPSGISQVPTLKLEVDSNYNGIFNEPEDFILFESAGDNQVVVRATVNSAGMEPAVNSSVMFGADSEEATFPLGDTKLTDANGQASALVQVDPSTVRNFSIPLSITALADNGAGNIVTVFLNPVTVSTVSVFANPATVSVGGTSEITATAATSAGGQLPDGTIVNFSSSCGQITPFSEVGGGIATATFISPEVSGSCTITASTGGVSGTASVTASTALSVQPGAITIDGNTGGTATFTIFGGTPGYTVISDNPLFPASPSAVSASGGKFTVSVPASTPDTSITYTVRDAAGATATASLTVSGLGALSVLPSSQSINSSTGGTATFRIFGGKPPYLIISDNPQFLPSSSTVTTSGGTFLVAVPAGSPETSVSYTIRDAAGETITASLSITAGGGASTDFFLRPEDVTISAGQSVTYVINGGTAPYIIFADRPGDVAIVYPGGASFTVVGINPASVTITVRDNEGREASQVLTIE